VKLRRRAREESKRMKGFIIAIAETSEGKQPHRYSAVLNVLASYADVESKRTSTCPEEDIGLYAYHPDVLREYKGVIKLSSRGSTLRRAL
jgi:hypothetical protein